MNGITKLIFEERAAQAPGQQKGKESEQGLHAAAPTDR
jgi:hypothetical protein